MENKFENDGFTIRQLFKVAFGQKIRLCIITFLIALAGVLFFKFVYNRQNKAYRISYEYEILSLDEGKYFDGTIFNYKSIVSLDSLKEIKNRSDEFASINVEKMFSEDAIKIEKNSKKDSAEAISFYYEITAKQRFFKNSAQATNFLKALSYVPYEKTLLTLENMKYDSYLNSYLDSLSYEIMISYLEKQYELIINNYNTLISTYGNTLLMNEKNVEAYRIDVETYFQNYVFNNLYIEINANGYVKEYEEYEAELLLKEEGLKTEWELNENIINGLQDKISDLLAQAGALQTVEISTYNEQISKYTIRNIEIDKELEIIKKKKDNKNQSTALFDTKLESYYEKMNYFTEEYRKIENEVIKENIALFYSTNNAETVGGKKIIVIGILSLLCGCFFGCAVNVCFDYDKLREKETNE